MASIMWSLHLWARIRIALASRKGSWRIVGSVIALSMRTCQNEIYHEKLRLHASTYLDHPVSDYMDGLTEQGICQTYSWTCCLVVNLHDYPKLRLLPDILDTNQTWAGASGDSQWRVQRRRTLGLIRERRFEEALKLLEQPMAEDSHNFDTQEPLARVYLMDERYGQEAVDLYEHKSNFLNDSEAPKNTDYLRLQNLVGTAYMKNEQYEKAITALKWAVEIHKEALDPVHPGRLASEHNLGRAYIKTNRFEEAASILEVLEIRRTILDVESPELLSA